MTEIPVSSSAPVSAAERARIRRRRRRAAKMDIRDSYFRALADGWTQEDLAKLHGVSVATVRREIDRAIAERQVRSPEQHIHLQIARVTKALALLNIRLDNGEMAAVAPFLKTVVALDRYHGLHAASRPPERTRPAQPLLPAPRLTLAHAAPPLELGLADEAEVGRDEA